MHYQDAARLSPLGCAQRQTGERIVLIYPNGDALVRYGERMRTAEPQEYCGYLDWEPVTLGAKLGEAKG